MPIKTRMVDTEHIIDGAITTEKLHALAVTAEKIAASSITAEKISVVQLAAIAVLTGTLTVDELISVGANRVIIDGANEIIKVYDEGANLRVEIGKLS